MSPAHALDRYYLAVTLLVTVGYQLLGFFIAWTLQFDKITDFTGGSNFFILALLTLLMGNTFYARNIVVSVFVMVWATRLAGFLLFRVLKKGTDARFDSIRSRFWSFLGFWIGQIVWVWVVSLPVIILNSRAVSDPSLGGTNPAFGTAADIVGVILWSIGWAIESIADAQKYRHKASHPPKDRATTVGLWSWSRHPPYFGEMLCWWGIWAICLSPAVDSGLTSSGKAALRGAVVSPLLTMVLLMFASGIPTAEKPTARRYFLMSHGSEDPEYPNAWSNYKEYLDSTSLLFPLPPAIYRRLPTWFKRTVLLDWGIYRFDEGVDGKRAIEEQSRA